MIFLRPSCGEGEGFFEAMGYIDSDRCAYCNRKETIDHCFINCSRVKRVWAHFVPTLSWLTQTTFRASVATVFFRWSSNHKRKNTIALFFIKLILYTIWTFCNAFTFRNRNEANAIIRYVSQDIISRVKLDHYHLPIAAFSVLWEVPGFCCINANPVQVFI